MKSNWTKVLIIVIILCITDIAGKAIDSYTEIQKAEIQPTTVVTND